MESRLLSDKLNQQLESIRELLQNCINLTEKCLDDKSAKMLIHRLKALESAALFVIVGEVKSGKSTFINALLHEEICETAPDPCTAAIQELIYGEEKSRISLGENWERISLPKNVLKEITIVDTPGTNSIIKRHQTITENYIPKSDLVAFVFPAKNPHTATAWDLLNFVRKDWLRKVVFILQQSDLATQTEININKEKVKQYARQHNIHEPVIFILSAKREMEGASDSGFFEFRQYLKNAVETGEVWQLKLESAKNTAKQVVKSISADLNAKKTEIVHEIYFYNDLITKIQLRKDKSDALRRLSVNSLCASYDTLTNKLENEFIQGLSVSSILRRSVPIIRDKDIKTWLNEIELNFEKAANEEIHKEASIVSKDIADEMQFLFDELDQAVSQREKAHKLSSKKDLSDQNQILSRLQEQLQNLRISYILGEKDIYGTNLINLSLAGGGLAALGAIIASATKLIVFDITGGIIAFAGTGLIAATLYWKRKSIIREIKEKLHLSRDEFRNRLDKKIDEIFEKLFFETLHCMYEPTALLKAKEAHIKELLDESQKLEQQLELF